ncbi:MAG: nitrogenase component 1 [Nitrososphaerota archaeon]|jgi:light-independent protochlorophyllide reductase B subunit|nr:nitrogenase component 1 [Nitrososphaerota archaeon]
MNNSSNTPHRPDSLTGAIAAFEGIQEACTILNGPIGCKFYTAYMASMLVSRHKTGETDFFEEFYFGQPRIPCTYIDEQDFVYGSELKVAQALKYVELKKPGLIGVINHSGISIIGDNLTQIIHDANIKTPAVAIDSAGFTGTYAAGFQNAVIKILGCVINNKNGQKMPRTVNIIGSTIFHYNWENDIAEIKRTLDLLGVKTISAICTFESMSNMQKVGQAELNLVLNEEYGNKIATYLEKEYGIPYICLNLQAPYGLSASEKWFSAVADFFGLSSKVITVEYGRVRQKCRNALLSVSSSANDLRGTPFAIFGDSSQVYALMTFFYEYLGLLPVVLGVKEVGAENFECLKNYVAQNLPNTALLVNPDQYELIDCFNQTMPYLLFGSSIEKNISLTFQKPPQFIPITFPYYEKTILTHRPIVGFNGVLTIVEDIINAIAYAKHRFEDEDKSCPIKDA